MRSLNKLLSVTGLTLLLAFSQAITPAKGQSSKIYIFDALVTNAIENTDGIAATGKIFNLPDLGNPLVLIANELKAATYSEVHLFVLTKPGSLIFDELNLLAENVGDYSTAFAEWKKYLPPGAKIIIHSEVLTSVSEGMAIIEKISELTGAEVLVQN